MIEKNRWLASACFAGVTGLSILIAVSFEKHRIPLIMGFLLSWGLVFPSFWALSWSLPKSENVFYKVFIGGILARFILLGLATFFVYRFLDMSLIVFLLATVGEFILLSFLEIYFIQRQTRLNDGL